jgi:hypothetical protein
VEFRARETVPLHSGVFNEIPKIITDQVKKVEVKFNCPAIRAWTFVFFEGVERLPDFLFCTRSVE